MKAVEVLVVVNGWELVWLCAPFGGQGWLEFFAATKP
jgi:hypothetical protein